MFRVSLRNIIGNEEMSKKPESLTIDVAYRISNSHQFGRVVRWNIKEYTLKRCSYNVFNTKNRFDTRRLKAKVSSYVTCVF